MSAWQPWGQRTKECHGPAHTPRRRGLRHRPGPRRGGRLVDAADRARRRARPEPLRRVPARAGDVPQGAGGAAEAARRGRGAVARAVPGTSGAARIPADPARAGAAARPGGPPGLGRHLGPGRRRNDGDDRRGLARGGAGARAARNTGAPAADAGPLRRAARPGGGHPVHGPVLLPGRVRAHRVLPARLGRDPGRQGLYVRVVHVPRPARRVHRGRRHRARRIGPAPGRAAGVRGAGAAAVPAAVRRGPDADDRAAPADLPHGRHEPDQAADAGHRPRTHGPRGDLPDPGHRGERADGSRGRPDRRRGRRRCRGHRGRRCCGGCRCLRGCRCRGAAQS